MMIATLSLNPICTNMSEYLVNQAFFFASNLDRLKENNQLRRRADFSQGCELFIQTEENRLLNLASNNYLGLAQSPLLMRAAQAATERYGTSSGGSRLVSGNFRLLNELENELCLFHKRRSALVLASGYDMNIALCTALAGRESIVFCDKLNHASIIDGVLLSRAKLVRYRHGDMEHLAFLLQKYKQAKHKILITDSVFSMDGDLADLPQIAKLCKENDVLSIVDEAHAVGVFGQGCGLVAACDLLGEIDIIMGTFSKAFGSQGGYICGDTPLVETVVNFGRPCMFSTAPSPAVVGASLAGLDFIKNSPQTAVRLLSIAEKVRTVLKDLGFEIGASASQIVPIILGRNETVLEVQSRLRQNGIFTAAIRPPAVPQNTARLRLALRADLQVEHIDSFFNAMQKIRTNRQDKL